MKYKSLIFRSVGYILLVLIIYFGVDTESLIENLKMIGPSSVVLLVFMATIDRFLMAQKWMYLCTALGMTVRFRFFLGVYYASSFLAYVIPTTIAAEAYRLSRLSIKENSHDVLASVFMERIIGIFAIVSLAWGGAFYISYNLANENSTVLLYMLGSLTILILITVWASLHTKIQIQVNKLLNNFRIGKYVEKLITAYSTYKNHKGLLLSNYLLATLETSLQIAIMCVVGVVLNIDVSLPMLASIITVTEFIRKAAITLDGWGFATALQIFMYSLVGLTVEQALLIAILSHAIGFIASAPGGVYLLADRWK